MTYGTGTRSYNRSAEKRALDKERAEATARYESAPKREITILVCECRSFRFAHRPEEHKKLKSDMDWRSWKQIAARWEGHGKSWKEISSGGAAGAVADENAATNGGRTDMEVNQPAPALPPNDGVSVQSDGQSSKEAQ